MSRRRWIWVDGRGLVPAEEFTPEPRAEFHVMPDISPYISQIDGSEITSRSKHREHLNAHGCIEIGNEKVTPRADLRGTGAKEALIHAVNQAKAQHGSRHVERAMTDALNTAHEMQRHRR